METLRRLGSELDIPLVMLGLAENSSRGKRHSEPPVKRRELLFSTAAAVLAGASLPGTVLADDEAAATVHAITTAHRRLDGITPSCELAEPVRTHLRMALGMQADMWDPLSIAAMAAAVSEAAGLAGWLHWDMHDLGSARRHYRLAVEQAQRSGDDPLLTAYMLGSLASFVVHEGDASEGLTLIKHAAKESGHERPATAEAWLAATEAVAHASTGDATQAWRALDRAEAAVGRVAVEEPPWPWVFPFDMRKVASHRLTCAVRLRRPDIAHEAAEDLAMVATGHRKQGALVLLDLASAHVQAREVEEALRVAAVAVDLAATTQSERVLNRAREFRRTVPATAPQGSLRDLDERLRTLSAPDRIN